MDKKQFCITSCGMTATIDAVGAQLRSLTDSDGKERLWCADPSVWAKTAPILFPICGGLYEDRYTHGGKTYTMPKHGFAQPSEFAAESIADDSVTLLLTSDEHTKELYPFDFEFRVRFALRDDALHVYYSTKNTGHETMYYSVGAHEAYACPGGIEEYDVVFDEEETLMRSVLNKQNYLTHETEHVETDGKTLHMKYRHMDNDSLCFIQVNSRGVELVHRETKKGIRLDFPDFNNFVLWTKQNAPYLCLEPWNGYSDYADTDGILAHKAGILTLAVGEEQTFYHKISLVK